MIDTFDLDQGHIGARLLEQRERFARPVDQNNLVAGAVHDEHGALDPRHDLARVHVVCQTEELEDRVLAGRLPLVLGPPLHEFVIVERRRREEGERPGLRRAPRLGELLTALGMTLEEVRIGEQCSLLLALGLAACGDETDSDTDRLSTATELADTWGEGWDTSDPEMVASVFTDDGKYASFDGNTYEGEENADHGRHGQRPRPYRGADRDLRGPLHLGVEAELGLEGRHRGTLEMELDSDLVSRLWWAEDPVPIE